MVGEIRDEETARLAMRLAITGHLVLSTLHTNESVGAITRLEDLGVEPFFIGEALNGVIAQRLVRKLCKECKEKYEPDEDERNLLNIKENKVIYKKKGCRACDYTGYNGRVIISEVFAINKDITYLAKVLPKITVYMKKSILFPTLISLSMIFFLLFLSYREYR